MKWLIAAVLMACVTGCARSHVSVIQSSGPHASARVYRNAIYREYTGATFRRIC